MKDIFRRNQRYFQVGNRIDAILAQQDIRETGFASEKPRNFIALLALVTIFQYVEGYTDMQAAEAVRTRTDWKFAMHLPLVHAGFDPVWLCAFRQHLFTDPSAANLLQNLADRMAETGLFDADPDCAPRSKEILLAVCGVNRLAQITEAVLFAVEALTAWGSASLPGVSLPELYEQYVKTYRRLREASHPEERDRLVRSIGADIQSILNSLEAASEKSWNEIPEVDYLQRIWQHQYGLPEGEESGPASYFLRPFNCSTCMTGIHA